MHLSNTVETYDFLTKNHIHWFLVSRELDIQKEFQKQLNKSGNLTKFYENSNLSIKNFIENVNLETKKNKTIVYITDKCYPSLSRQAEFMKKNGYKTFLISMDSLSQQNLEMIIGSFDNIIQNLSFFPTLGKVLNSITPNFFHVQCWMWQYSLGKFVIQKNIKSKVISDFYDITGMYANHNDLNMVFPKFIIKQDFDCEKFIFENSDGIIHRYKQSVLNEYAKKYKKKGKILEFQQYPVEIVDSKNKLNKKNQSYKFVFCGILIAPDDQTQPKELFNSAGLHYTFKKILENNHEIGVFLPLSYSQQKYKWLFDLKQQFLEKLNIYKFLPIKELIKEISNYDFGINFQKFDIKKTKVSKYTYNGGMGTKNYTYLEAGLPIIINKEYKYHDELVSKNKIGISLMSKDLDNLNFLINKANIKELKKNVRKFNIKNNLYKKGKELLSFYESL